MIFLQVQNSRSDNILSTTPERTRKAQVNGFNDWGDFTWLAGDEQEATPSLRQTFG